MTMDRLYPLYPYLIPKCQHLTLILNRAALSLMQCTDTMLSHDVLRCDSRSKKAHAFLLSFARSVKSYADLSNYYVMNDRLSRFEYVFSLVKCGKCLMCCHAKQVDMINRVQMESSCYDSPCYMITLTYDNKHLPINRKDCSHIRTNTLYYRDVQNFFKRLRIRWSRAGLHHDIRYLVAGEYGHLHGRPHWHILLWNNPYGCCEFSSPFSKSHNILNHRKLCDDVFSAWSMCSRDAFQCEPAGDGAAAYVSKYLTKQALYRVSHAGVRPPFIRCSSRHGGIGAPAVYRHASYYRNNSHLQEFTFRTYSGEVKSVPITSFISSKLYPSASRQVPRKYKELFRSMVDCSHHALSYGLVTQCEVNNMLSYYSLGLLFFTYPKAEVIVPLSRNMHAWASSRIVDCYNSLLDDLDAMKDTFEIDLSFYNEHKRHILIDDANRDFAQRIFSINSYLSKQLSKEVL